MVEGVLQGVGVMDWSYCSMRIRHRDENQRVWVGQMSKESRMDGSLDRIEAGHRVVRVGSHGGGVLVED
ncbi:hypothetical protein V6N13_097593 [Hibiscus sabdariffa]|uniref:Uncharacterized protein n=1 Tax=Hibiscus sabdariffa TaxID=183260 RepID=A0ABR2BUK8_9ROSI